VAERPVWDEYGGMFDLFAVTFGFPNRDQLWMAPTLP
jgi:hypothetical protein